MRYAEPSATPLTDRILAQGGHLCDACGSVIMRSPRAFAYHVKKCTKRLTPPEQQSNESERGSEP